jgi:Collagen triple helix repeat (20 copies)
VKTKFSMVKPSSTDHNIYRFDGNSLTADVDSNFLAGTYITEMTYLEGKGTLQLLFSDGSTISITNFLKISDLEIQAVTKKGISGTSGLLGRSGKQGRDGQTGREGGRGATGDIGQQGDIGDDGVKGPKGFYGDDGLPGNLGPRGSVGIRGLMGKTGNRGDFGEQGSEGLSRFVYSLIEPIAEDYAGVAIPIWINIATPIAAVQSYIRTTQPAKVVRYKLAITPVTMRGGTTDQTTITLTLVDAILGTKLFCKFNGTAIFDNANPDSDIHMPVGNATPSSSGDYLFTVTSMKMTWTLEVIPTSLNIGERTFYFTVQEVSGGTNVATSNTALILANAPATVASAHYALAASPNTIRGGTSDQFSVSLKTDAKIGTTIYIKFFGMTLLDFTLVSGDGSVGDNGDYAFKVTETILWIFAVNPASTDVAQKDVYFTVHETSGGIDVATSNTISILANAEVTPPNITNIAISPITVPKAATSRVTIVITTNAPIGRNIGVGLNDDGIVASDLIFVSGPTTNILGGSLTVTAARMTFVYSVNAASANLDISKSLILTLSNGGEILAQSDVFTIGTQTEILSDRVTANVQDVVLSNGTNFAIALSGGAPNDSVTYTKTNDATGILSETYKISLDAAGSATLTCSVDYYNYTFRVSFSSTAQMLKIRRAGTPIVTFNNYEVWRQGGEQQALVTVPVTLGTSNTLAVSNGNAGSTFSYTITDTVTKVSIASAVQTFDANGKVAIIIPSDTAHLYNFYMIFSNGTDAAFLANVK